MMALDPVMVGVGRVARPFFNGLDSGCKMPLPIPNYITIMSLTLFPGAFVRLPAQPDWGLGQVQSVDGHRVTVNFENAGKRLILTDKATLIEVDAGRRDP
jgi:hypothetical protein